MYIIHLKHDAAMRWMYGLHFATKIEAYAQLLGQLTHLARKERAVTGFGIGQIQGTSKAGMYIDGRFQCPDSVCIQYMMSYACLLEKGMCCLQARCLLRVTKYLQQPGALFVVQLVMI